MIVIFIGIVACLYLLILGISYNIADYMSHVTMNKNENLPYECSKCKKVNNCYSGCRAWTNSYIEGKMDINVERDDRCEPLNAFVGN